jgi:hypothetical protein
MLKNRLREDQKYMEKMHKRSKLKGENMLLALYIK